ncbi:MAG: 4-hydroxy-tetrahydrodipicolinate synthase [Alphaproteobacteria bacterium]
MFKGSFTALITPFTEDRNAVDEKAFAALVQRQMDAGTHGLVPCGTTGESPTLNHREHKRVIQICVETAAGKIPVIAGTGSNSTREAVSMTREAKEDGVDAVLSVVPYYNKPSQEGLYQHFKAIAEVGVPVILYNIPGRSVVQISNETFARLAKLPNIVGVKDATADLEKPLATKLALGPDFCQFSGEDATILPFLVQGGHACISVTANIAPKLCADLHNAWQAGDLATAQKINEKLYPVHNAMFCETNPAPAKYASKLLGLTTGTARLPMVEISEASKKIVEAALKGADLL